MKTNMILCGDALDLLAGFPVESVDLVVTDPPYLVGYRDRFGRSVRNDDNPDAVLGVYDELYRVMKDHSYCVTFCGWTAIAGFAGAWDKAGFRTVGHIVWPKPYASRSGHTRYRHESAYLLAKGFPKLPADPPSDIQPWDYTGNRRHPTQKAVSVLAPLIRAYSKPGDVVLDPFAGSGSTLVAAMQERRRWLGIELEQDYCDSARERIARMQCLADWPNAA